MTRPVRLVRPLGRPVTIALLLLALALGPGAALASFHLVSISELGAGFLGNPNVQFVELRLDAPGQTQLTDTRLTAFDKDGVATVLLLTPNAVTDGRTGRNVLYATAEFQAATGLEPDYVIPAGIVGPSGMICWGAPGATVPDPMSWDFRKPESYVDCVAYGGYPHPTRPAAGAPSTLTPGDGVRALARQKNTGAAGDNAGDFALTDLSACNNAGQCATPGSAPGKSERACRRAIIKAGTAFASAYGKALVGCETQRLKGTLTGTCPDAKTAARIVAADERRTRTLTKACGTLPPAQLGFGTTCPGATGACTAPLAAIADVATCLDCGLRRGSDELTATVYAAPPDAGVLKCQLALGKATVSHARSVAGLLARCEDAVARGKLTGPCPDAKTATKLDVKAARFRTTLCAACGGKDRLCDGSGDATPTALGITSCPARTVPGGAGCATPIVDLTDAVACAECLATFEGACGTALVATPWAMPASCAMP